MNPSEVLGKTYLISADKFNEKFSNDENFYPIRAASRGLISASWSTSEHCFRYLYFQGNDEEKTTINFENFKRFKIKLLNTCELNNKPAYKYEIIASHEDTSNHWQARHSKEYLIEALVTFNSSSQTIIRDETLNFLLEWGLTNPEEVKEDHTGMIFNPITNTWGWGFF